MLACPEDPDGMQVVLLWGWVCCETNNDSLKEESLDDDRANTIGIGTGRRERREGVDVDVDTMNSNCRGMQHSGALCGNSRVRLGVQLNEIAGRMV